MEFENDDIIKILPNNTICILIDLSLNRQDNISKRVEIYTKMLKNHYGMIAPKHTRDTYKDDHLYPFFTQKQKEILDLMYAPY